MRFRRKAKVGRQRTRTDQISQPAAPKFNYGSRRSETDRDTGRDTKRETPRVGRVSPVRFWLQRFGLLILLIAIIASVINVLTLSSTANIQPLNSASTATVSTNKDTYRAFVDELLAESLWNHNKLTINTGQISQLMRAKYPELSSVSVTLPLLAHRPIVYLQTAQPTLILVSNGKSLLVDADGKVLAKAADTASLQQPNLPVVTDQSGLSPEITQQALPAGDVSFIQTVVAQLNAKHINLASLTLPVATRELDVRIASQPYMIKFNLQSGDARQQAGTFLATIGQLQKQAVTPTQYIDVRVDGRAYYQ